MNCEGFTHSTNKKNCVLLPLHGIATQIVNVKCTQIRQHKYDIVNPNMQQTQR